MKKFLPAIFCFALACQGETSDSTDVDKHAENPPAEDSDCDGADGEAPEPGEDVDPWVADLDRASVWPVADGFVIAGFDADDVEIGRITVTAPSPDVLIAEHRYPRPCVFNDVECAEVFVVTIDYEAPAVDRQFNETLPVELLEQRTEALVVKADEQEQELAGNKLKCALAVLPSIAACGGGSPLKCAVTIIAAACSCKEQIKKMFPKLTGTIDKVCD